MFLESIGLLFFSITAIIFYISYKNIIIINEEETVIIEKFGKFSTVLQTGLHLLIPFIETPRHVTWSRRSEISNGKITTDKFYGYRIDTREQCYDPPPFDCLTSDNIPVKINLVTYYKITNIKEAVYAIDDLWLAMENSLLTELSSIMKEVVSKNISTSSLEGRLLTGVNAEIAGWGIKISKIKIQDCEFPKEIRDAIQQLQCSEQVSKSEMMKLKNEHEKFEIKRQYETEELLHKLSKEKSENDHKLQIEYSRHQSRLKILEEESRITNNPVNKDIALAKIHAESFQNISKNANIIVVPYDATRYIGSHINLFDNIKEYHQLDK